jgi:hypothetical protein
MFESPRFERVLKSPEHPSPLMGHSFGVTYGTPAHWADSTRAARLPLSRQRSRLRALGGVVVFDGGVRGARVARCANDRLERRAFRLGLDV